MTATIHFIDTKAETRKVARNKGRETIGSLLFRFLGIALVFAAIGMWLAPGASYSTDLILMKLGVSVFFAMMGILLLVNEKRPSDG